ncbi:faa49e5d-dc94-41da-854a-1ca9a7b81e4f [Thermothielavioides terrestris]|uniref:Faa49e5d-dc94-41da-854a-1ca9a7b81e4f n=1 Tax=Thermothielavioides terrestris TaxID=2587410 RepID=A0A446BS13_9PEZI|nr:faa49e5d-dc94-41da-854a-1ca9a7b81e4f [Thermothielavioides terrestris]
MAHVLVADRDFIGGPHDQWMFIWGNLSRGVQAKVVAFYKSGGPSYNYNPGAFLEYLSTVYVDPHKQVIALTELDILRQGDNEPFSSFIIRFEAKLSKAGGLNWSDEGHFVATCPFAPAKRPAPQVDINKLEAEEWVEEDSPSKEEEGKE